MNRKTLIIAGIAAITAILTIGYGLYYLSWFWKYWIMIGLILAVVTVLAYFNLTVRSWIGRNIVGELLSNNNAWWYAGVVATAIFAIAAMLASFGEPLLVSSSRQAKQNLYETAGSNNIAAAASLTSDLKRIFWGTNSTPATTATIMAAPTATRKYPSWIWWKITFLLGISTFIDTFFAFSDEVKRAIILAIKRVERRKRLDNIRSSLAATRIIPPPVTITPAAGATSPLAEPLTAKNLWKHLVQIEVLTEFIEIFIKLLSRRIFNA